MCLWLGITDSVDCQYLFIGGLWVHIPPVVRKTELLHTLLRYSIEPRHAMWDVRLLRHGGSRSS
jgi:hypothetical protein